ncbi:MAG: phosphatidate cytidylyltransferase [Bifidobacteriaceae bacterium]|jgi:phosphatidate cytidylyltransferase|nr:phosphatidate cytidylyltransferase [Bifidobacteriaceae bacterium]
MAAPIPESAAQAGRGRNLAVAVPTALGLIAVVLASLLIQPARWAGPWIFVGLVVVALALALHELIQALGRVGFRVPYSPLVVGAALTQVAAAATGAPGVVVGVFLTLAASMLWRVLEGDYRQTHDAAVPGPGAPVQFRDPGPGGGWEPAGAAADGSGDTGGSGGSGDTGGTAGAASGRSLTQDLYAIAFATVYLPALGALVVLLSFLPDGRWLVLLLVAVPVASDTGGYFAGSHFGKHKLAPLISPKKTWEGLAGSILLALVAGVGGMLLMRQPWYFGVALAVLGALAATLGDLAESLLKRDIGIKDMGSLLPGHGGVLDRVDSILMTAPFFYAVIALFGTKAFG